MYFDRCSINVINKVTQQAFVTLSGRHFSTYFGKVFLICNMKDFQTMFLIFNFGKFNRKSFYFKGIILVNTF